MSSPAPVRSAGNFEREKVEVVIIAPPETPRVERKKEVRNDKPVLLLLLLLFFFFLANAACSRSEWSAVLSEISKRYSRN